MTRIISAVYDSRADAEAAATDLRNAGIAAANVDIHQQDGATPVRAGATPVRGEGFVDSLKGFFGFEDSYGYAEAIRRGHHVLTARVEDSQVETATRILEGSNAVDFDARQTEWRSAGWTGYPTGSKDKTIPVVDETLSIGKREIGRGSVRVRSYIVEEPVSQPVRLREEHVSVERRPVNQPVENAGDLLRERTIEMSETAEEAVIAKDAVVREEVSLKKTVTEKNADITDKVRRTKIAVEDNRTGARNKP